MRDEVIKLDLLAMEVADCRLCEAQGLALEHLPAVHRGGRARLLVLGVQPDKAEIGHGRLLAGRGGERLLAWLVAAGVGRNPDDALIHSYVTTLCKCHVPGGRGLRRAIQNCAGFLQREIEVVRPEVCMTLGREPLVEVFRYVGPLEAAVGRAWREDELGLTLFPVLPEDCLVVPFPKPHGVAQWLRRPGRQARLDRALETLRRALPS